MDNIDIENLKYILETSKSLTEVLKKLGKERNGGNFRSLKKIMLKNNLTFSNNRNNKEKYKKSPKKCLNCGKELDYEHRYNKYCSSSCAAIVNNRKYPKKVKKEIKPKIDIYTQDINEKYNTSLNNDALATPKVNKKSIKNNEKDVLFCVVCGKKLSGNQKKYCSKKCKNKMYSHTMYHTKYSRKKDENGMKTKYEYILKLGGKCSICGYDKNFSALCFHHLKDKKFTLDARTFERCPKDLLEEEISKCVLVCQNCHHEIHHPQHNKEIYIKE